MTGGEDWTPKDCNEGPSDWDCWATVCWWVGVSVITTTVKVVKVEVCPFEVMTDCITLVEDVVNGVVGSVGVVMSSEAVVGGGGVVVVVGVVEVVGCVEDDVVDVAEVLDGDDVPVVEVVGVTGVIEVVEGVVARVDVVVVVIVSGDEGDDVVEGWEEVVVLFEACRLANAYTLEANLTSSFANASIACRFDVNTPSLKCGYTACNA